MRLKVTTSKAITPFKAYPLNSTTLLIAGQDATHETPNIILKRYPREFLIIDTGLGGLYPPTTLRHHTTSPPSARFWSVSYSCGPTAAPRTT